MPSPAKRVAKVGAVGAISVVDQVHGRGQANGYGAHPCMDKRGTFRHDSVWNSAAGLLAMCRHAGCVEDPFVVGAGWEIRQQMRHAAGEVPLILGLDRVQRLDDLAVCVVQQGADRPTER